MTVTSPGPRLLESSATDYADHLRRLGPLPTVVPALLRQVVADSGLQGRGGAAFPAWRKWASVAAGGASVVVANGAEGEPASSKDRTLLTRAPHLVLDGLTLASHAVGARVAYLYAPADLLDGPVCAALAQRRDDLPVRMIPAPDTFIAGQETAAVSVINGGRPIPNDAPPTVFERGVNGRPTLVQNVETLAQVALVARFGPRWFRRLGTPAEPGTRLMTITGSVHAPGVYELPGGSTLSSVLHAAGGAAEPVQALLVGGYHGGWVPWDTATAMMACAQASLARYDAAPGAGVVIALAADRCGVQAGADIATYLAGQSAGQCGPCRNGLPRVADLLHTLAYGPASTSTLTELERIVALVDGRGSCHHPDGTARLVRSTLRTFRSEVYRHLQGHCSTPARRHSRGAR